MFAALDIQYAMRMRHIVICGLLYNIFPHYRKKCTILEKSIEHEMCFEFL